MRKILCLLFAVLMLLCLAACEKPEAEESESQKQGNTPQENKTVTIYMLESVTAISGNETTTLTVILEEGWQDKESITAQFRMKGPESIGYNMHYEEKRTVIDYGDGAQKIIILYDDNGRAISQTVEFPAGASVLKNETLTTYDEKGRILKQETKIYTADQEPQVVQSAEYTYEDTENGSKGTSVSGGIVQEIYYDVKGRGVKTVTTVNGLETTRVETTYDADGNQTKQETYVSGTLTTTTVNTYKACEIDAEKASKMPYFKQTQ